MGSPTSRCKPMTGFLNVEAGSRGACASLLLYSALTTHLAIAAPAARPSLSTYMCLSSVPSPTLTSLRPILTSLAARLARRRACVHPAARIFDASLSTRRKIAQIQGVHAADADRMHTDRDLRPLLVEPPWSSSLTPPRTSREELQTASCTPLRLMIVFGGHDGSGA
ncbi:hypothetical protein B0H14DRAFT_208503 [Mycena olivaceomarginata]|nr:hypothetical protein B0H14DRAFT_208503 [Mycena olivaceomarginata]